MRTGEPNPWNAFFDRRERVWGVFLLFFAVATRAYSIIVTGAKFWIDSVVYFQLALALFDADQLGRLYNSEFGFLYQHASPGLPFLIRALDGIFDRSSFCRVDRVCARQTLSDSLYATTAFALAVGTLAFLQSRHGDRFFLPNVSALMLTHVSYVAWDLEKDAWSGR